MVPFNCPRIKKGRTESTRISARLRVGGRVQETRGEPNEGEKCVTPPFSNFCWRGKGRRRKGGKFS